MEWVAVAQQLNRDLFAIEMVKRGLSNQKEEVSSISLFDHCTGNPISKGEFKELASAGMIIDQINIEAIIGLVASAIETFSIRAERHLNIKWETFKHPENEIPYAPRTKQFRALNNVFKHLEGYVDSNNSRSAKYLVDNGYFTDKTYLKYRSAKDILPNMEQAIYEAFAHLYYICCKHSNMPNLFSEKTGSALVKEIKKIVLYQIVEFNANIKS